jgi:L-iditol 2-dehydrogenase
MKVAVYYRNDDIRIEERPMPSISNNEILVKMKACGICGTDVMEWYRIKKSPRVLGHEAAGEIVEVGSNVEGFKTGDRVFVSHHVPCYRCHHCLQGKYTACELLHTGNYYPGGFSEYIRVPEENVRYGTFILPPNLSYEDAAMIEPLACAVAGQNQIGINESQTILIIGSGVSGILHIQLANLKKAMVISTDISGSRLMKALAYGAEYVINAQIYSVDELIISNENRLADIVIICTAAKQAIAHAISSIDKKGKILFFAVPESDISIPSFQFWRDEITMTFSYGAAPDDLKQAINLIDSGLINVREMITHRVPLSSITQGFKLVAEAKNSLKVVVVPDKDI